MTTASSRVTLPIIRGGTPIEEAAGAIILLHGRGGSAEDILALGKLLANGRTALLAPQAPEHTWYPYSFLAPRPNNEPYLSSALRQVEASTRTRYERRAGRFQNRALRVFSGSLSRD